MYTSRLVRFSICFFGVVLVWLFGFSRPAAADNIVTVNVTATTGPCGGANCGGYYAAGILTSTVTGTFSFDETTQQIVGPWSFSSTVIGGFDSSDNAFGGATFLAGQPVPFEFWLNGGDEYRVGLDWNPDTLGPLLGGYMELNGGSWVFTSGEATVVSSTPEPASLLLLGTGLLAFTPVVRRRFRRI